MKKSIPGKTPKIAVSEKSGSGSGDSGLRGLLDGRFAADNPLGDGMRSVGCKWVYIFNRRMAKKLTPVVDLLHKYPFRCTLIRRLHESSLRSDERLFFAAVTGEAV
jgi:hypothetical protein